MDRITVSPNHFVHLLYLTNTPPCFINLQEKQKHLFQGLTSFSPVSHFVQRYQSFDLHGKSNVQFLYEKQHWTEMDQFVNIKRKIAETATGDVFLKKISLEYRKTRKYLCQSLFSLKLQVEACNVIKKRDWYRCFPMNFVKFLRAPFLQNTSGRVLL